MITKQHTMNFYNGLHIAMFGFKELKIVVDGQKQNFTGRFVLFMFLTKMINLMTLLRNKLNINGTKIHALKLTSEGTRSIIMDTESTWDGTLINFHSKMETINPSDQMIKTTILNFELVDGDNKTCLKNLIVKYKDLDEKCDNTLQNILEFNDIEHTHETMVNIKKFKNGKMNQSTVNISQIMGMHINTIINM
jgi:hypothetical protein